MGTFVAFGLLVWMMPGIAIAQIEASACAPPATGSDNVGVSGGFHPMTPVRVLDTRFTTGVIGPGCTVVVDMVSVAPAQATGVAVDVVATDATGPGFVTVYPCDTERPLASNLNPRVDDPTPNAVLVPLLESRRICLFTSVATQLVVDVMGWFGPAGASFHGVQPQRVLDTRTPLRPDGGTGAVVGGTTIEIPIAGLDPVPGGAAAISVNITVTDTETAGFITAFPCGVPPLSSNGNYLAQDIRASHAVVGLDGAGRLCVYSSATTHLVLDVAGWFGGTDGERLHPIVGTRVLDSRDGTGDWSGPIGAGEVRSFDPTMEGTVPVGSVAVFDVVATQASDGGFLTLFPCGGPVPPTSSVNYLPGNEATNLVVVPLGGTGTVCVYSHRQTHVVVDVMGSLGSAGALRALSVAGNALVPPFSPDGHDYGVICAAGDNDWVVDAVPVPGAIVAVSGADPSGHVSVSEDELVTVTVTRADTSVEEYFVRCLPHDFPVLAVQQPDDSSPAWFLTGTGLNALGGPNYAIILDDRGAPLWYQKTSQPALDVKRLSNGNLAWTGLLGFAFGTTPDGVYEERSLDGALVRTWKTACTVEQGDANAAHCPTDHHDMIPVPGSDNMLMITYHLRTNVDLTAIGLGAAANVVDAWIQEVAPDGSVAWWWHSEDHIGVAETRAQTDGVPITFTIPNPDGPGTISVVDLVHANSIEIDPATGDVVFSGRHLDAVYRIRRHPGQPDDKKVLWKLGGGPASEVGAVHFSIVGDPDGGTARQHDARLLPNGNVTIFDNQTARPNSSRAVEYELDVGAGTATMVWQYVNPQAPPAGQAFGLGSARRASDGSTAVGWGPLAPFLTDVGPWGNPTLHLTYNGMVYRVTKEPASSFDRATLRSLAGS